MATNGTVTLVGGGGSGATAAPSYGITPTNFTITNGGSYTTIPTGNNVSGGGGVNGIVAASFGINTIAVTTGGSGYTDGAAVPVTFTGGGGSGDSHGQYCRRRHPKHHRYQSRNGLHSSSHNQCY